MTLKALAARAVVSEASPRVDVKVIMTELRSLNMNMDAKMNKLEEKIDAIEVKMDAKMNKLEEKIDAIEVKMDAKMNKLEEKMDNHSHQFVLFRCDLAKTNNRASASPDHPILPIPLAYPNHMTPIPESFPHTLHKLRVLEGKHLDDMMRFYSLIPDNGEKLSTTKKRDRLAHFLGARQLSLETLHSM
jgi:hypothetical protein